MLSSYLRSSTIHGLPYVGKRDQRPLYKAAWLACVAVSLVVAGILIASNVQNFLNQPGVVSTVDMALVIEKPWMPQILVCPESPNPTAMLMNLLKARPDLISDQALQETTRYFTRLQIAHRQKQNMDQFLSVGENIFSLLMDTSMFTPCFANTTELTEPCDFILALYSVKQRFSGRLKPGEVLLEYAAALSVSNAYGPKRSAEGLKLWVQEKYHVVLEDVTPGVPVDAWEMAQLYAVFFPLLVESSGQWKDAPLQSLSSYSEYPTWEVTRGNLPEIWAWLIQSGLFEETQRDELNSRHSFRIDVKSEDYLRTRYVNNLEGLISRTWLWAMRDHLGASDADETARILSATLDKADTTYSALFSYARHLERDPCRSESVNGTKEPKSLIKGICSAAVTALCKEYCEMILKKNSEKRQHKLSELLTMGYINPASISSSSSSGAFGGNFLSMCQHPFESVKCGEGCWERVFNERGVCFSSKNMLNIVPGLGPDSSTHILVDFGRYFSAQSVLPGLRAFPGWRPIEEKHMSVTVAPAYQDTEDNLLTAWPPSFDFAVSINDTNAYYALDVTTAVEGVGNATAEFRAIAPSRRDCLFHDERELEFFPSYSEGNCHLGCSWRMAEAKCGCVPWYLVDRFPGTNMCELYGNRCFDSMVESRYVLTGRIFKECRTKCPLDCVNVVYKSRFDRSENSLYPRDISFVKEYYKRVLESQPKIVADIISNIGLTAYMEKEDVNNRKILLLRPNINEKLANQVVRTATMTKIDLVANTGGTLGLFCGFSILSLVEILYWSLKYLGSKCRSSRKSVTLLHG